MVLTPRIDTIEQNILGTAPNVLINGAMDYWNRTNGATVTVGSTGGSVDGVTQYFTSADRFMIRAGGSSVSADVSQSTDVPNSTCFFANQYVGTAGTATTYQMLQRIEAINIQPFIGRTMTFSCWVKQEVVTAPINILIGTPASGVRDSWATDPNTFTTELTSPVMTFTLGQWTRISYTFVVPPNAINGMCVDTLSTYTGNISIKSTGWMLTEGSNPPTNFYRNQATAQAELAACQRYYHRLTMAQTGPVCICNTQTATVYRALLPLPVSMRAATSIRVSAPGDFRVSTDATTILTPTSISVGPIDLYGRSMLLFDINVASTAGTIMGVFRNNGASFIAINGEL